MGLFQANLTSPKYLIKTASEMIGGEIQDSRPPWWNLDCDWLKATRDKLLLKFLSAQKARQAQAVIGG